MSAAPVRVALVEDNAVFREALELLLGLRSDIDVVGSVEDGTKVVDMCSQLDPDVVIMDFRLPALDGVQATRALRDGVPGRRRRLPDRLGEPPRGRRALSQPAPSRA